MYTVSCKASYVDIQRSKMAALPGTADRRLKLARAPSSSSPNSKPFKWHIMGFLKPNVKTYLYGNYVQKPLPIEAYITI